jgi:hypothetical protein
MRRYFIGFILLVLAGVARGDGLDIFVNNDTVSVDYLTTYRGSDLSFGFLTSTSSNWVAHGGLLVLGREYGSGSKIEGGLGAKIYVASAGGNSVTAAAIGGQIAYFPQSSKFGIGGYAYFAPDIITFGGTGLTEYGVRAEFQMVETASAYVGIHNIAITPDGVGTVTVNDGLHVGINLRF